jgi:hypothetical protein
MLPYPFLLFILLFSYFSNRVLYFGPWLALDHDPSLYDFHIVGFTDVHCHTCLVRCVRDLLTFSLSWSQTTTLLSTSQVTRDYRLGLLGFENTKILPEYRELLN